MPRAEEGLRVISSTQSGDYRGRPGSPDFRADAPEIVASIIEGRPRRCCPRWADGPALSTAVAVRNGCSNVSTWLIGASTSARSRAGEDREVQGSSGVPAPRSHVPYRPHDGGAARPPPARPTPSSVAPPSRWAASAPVCLPPRPPERASPAKAWPPRSDRSSSEGIDLGWKEYELELANATSG